MTVLPGFYSSFALVAALIFWGVNGAIHPAARAPRTYRNRRMRRTLSATKGGLMRQHATTGATTGADDELVLGHVVRIAPPVARQAGRRQKVPLRDRIGRRYWSIRLAVRARI